MWIRCCWAEVHTRLCSLSRQKRIAFPTSLRFWKHTVLSSAYSTMSFNWWWKNSRIPKQEAHQWIQPDYHLSVTYPTYPKPGTYINNIPTRHDSSRGLLCSNLHKLLPAMCTAGVAERQIFTRLSYLHSGLWKMRVLSLTDSITLRHFFFQTSKRGT